MSEKIEKPKGRTMNEIIIDMDKGPSGKNQVSRILEEQTEMMAKRVQKSEMEQIMAESERKKIEEENRLKLARGGQMPAEPQPKEGSQEAKTVLEAVKIGLEAGRPQQQQGSITDMAKSMADMFKTGVEVGKGQAQPQVQQQNPLDAYKVVQEMMKPVLDELKATREHNTELRMKEIESKIVNPIEYIESVKKSAQTLGFTSGGKTPVDIEIEKMQQSERLDNRRIAFEEKKFDAEQANEGKGLETVKEILAGPAGEVLKMVGAAGADRMRGSAKTTGNMVQVQCPACKGTFMANPNLSAIGCPNCGAKLEKQQAPPTPETATPEPQPQPEQPQPEQPSWPSQTEVTNIVDLNKR